MLTSFSQATGRTYRIALLVLTVAALPSACSDSNNSGSVLDCPDLVGEWPSSTYNAFRVTSDGESTKQPDALMTLEITEQDGCGFRAVNRWSNGEFGSAEYVAGLIHQGDDSVTIVELPNENEDVTTGLAVGKLRGDHMDWSYVGTRNDGRDAVALRTVLSRETLVDSAVCPDISGEWRSSEYQALRRDASGAETVLEGLSMVLEVEEQVGCAFRGYNVWSNGEIGGREIVAGVIHEDAEFVSIVELGPHPIDGSSAEIRARLVDGEMEWAYTGLSSQGDHGFVFRSKLSRSGDVQMADVCPDMLGNWESGRYDAFTVDGRGDASTIENLVMTLRVDSQQGCLFGGVNEWSNGDIGGSEPVLGVLYADGTKSSVVEIGLPPYGGSAGLVTGIALGENQIRWEYAGLAADGSKATVFGATIRR